MAEHNSEGIIPVDRPAFSGEVETQEDEKVQELDAKDVALAKLYTNSDWLAFEDLVKTELIDLRQLKGVKAEGASNDELGQQFRVANLAADMIEKFLFKVREAAETVKQNEKDKSGNN